MSAARDSLWDAARRRVRMELSDGHMDVCLSPDASPETVEALKQIGEAALARMKEDESDRRDD